MWGELVVTGCDELPWFGVRNCWSLRHPAMTIPTVISNWDAAFWFVQPRATFAFRSNTLPRNTEGLLGCLLIYTSIWNLKEIWRLVNSSSNGHVSHLWLGRSIQLQEKGQTNWLKKNKQNIKNDTNDRVEVMYTDLHSTFSHSHTVLVQLSWIKLVGSLSTYLGSSYLAPAISFFEPCEY